MNHKPKHRKETSMRKLMAGMDLHSNNVVAGIVDQDGKRIAHQKLDCDLRKIIGFL